MVDSEGAAYRCAILASVHQEEGATEDHSGEHYFKREAAGRVSPVPPDPERDRRRAAYAEHERRRVSRRLAEWFRVALLMRMTIEDLLGKRFLDEIANYLLAPGEFCGNRVEHGEHPWSDYGVPKSCDGVPPAAHKSHYGVPCQHPNHPLFPDDCLFRKRAHNADSVRADLCSCPAMEQPHIRGRFTLCPPAGE